MEFINLSHVHIWHMLFKGQMSSVIFVIAALSALTIYNSVCMLRGYVAHTRPIVTYVIDIWPTCSCVMRYMTV